MKQKIINPYNKGAGKVRPKPKDNMTITHDDEPILTGPMSNSEFLKYLKTRIGPVKFIERAKSKNPVHPYSNRGEGYIIMQLGELGPVLYDSVRNPAAYMSATGAWGLLVGRHNDRGEYFTLDVNWEGALAVIESNYRPFGQETALGPDPDPLPF